MTVFILNGSWHLLMWHVMVWYDFSALLSLRLCIVALLRSAYVSRDTTILTRMRSHAPIQLKDCGMFTLINAVTSTGDLAVLCVVRCFADINHKIVVSRRRRGSITSSTSSSRGAADILIGCEAAPGGRASPGLAPSGWPCAGSGRRFQNKGLPAH